MKNKSYLSALILALVLMLSVSVSAADAADFAGKKVSVLGDSISTYTGVSNDATMNSTIGGNAIYYTAGKLGVYRSDTWWQQGIDLLDMELLVNNSWSGSAIHTDRAGKAAYKERCVQLHDDIDKVDPDIIWSFLGTNDFSWYTTSKWGTVEAINFDTLIVKGASGYTYATPTTVYEAYAIMLHKMTQRYPEADIYVMSLLSRRDPVLPSNYVDNGQPTAINAGIKKLVEKMGCTFVDLERRITKDPADFDLCIGDQKVHPNPIGHDRITEAVLSAMLGGDEAVCTVTNELNGAEPENDACLVLAGSKYETKINVSDGYASADVTVTMGGKDITAECYKNGTVTIESVTGDIVLSGRGTAAFTGSYRWEMNAAGNDFVSVTSGGNTSNPLTRTNGTVSGGKMNKACFAIDDTVYLLPTEEWTIEWKVNGKWTGLLMCTNDANTSGMTYIFRSGSYPVFAIGTYDGSWRNYGLTLPASFDETAEHVYRVENRVAADGSNMTYLVIDGMEIGSLNNYYSGTTNQNAINNWANGATLAFNHMGKVANSHYLTMEMEYLQIWASGPAEHKHAYVITQSSSATCREDGVVTYTCTTCGHSHSEVSKADENLHRFGPWLRAEKKLTRTCSACQKIESKEMLAYRWEMNTAGNALVSVTSDGNTSNPLTKTNGSISGGVLNQACFAIEDTVTLRPADEWVIEWKSSGNWQGLLLCTNDSNVSGMNYIYRNKKVPLMSFGEYDGSDWYNYGVVDTADTTAHHVYRVENRVSPDGTNTAYYLIDGVEVGALTNYYRQASNQNTVVNWLNGQTLTFNHMGKTANSHYLSMDLDYLQIWTNGEPREFEDALAEVNKTGGTLVLSGDTTVSALMLNDGVTLDLAGYTLTCDYAMSFGGYIVDSSAEKSGKLACMQGMLMLDPANPALAVWNGTDGYFFTDIEQVLTQEDASVAGKYKLTFLPKFTQIERIAPLLADNGGEDNGVKIMVKLLWNGGEKTLTYSEDMVKTVYGGNAFTVTLTGYEAFLDLGLKLQVVVECNGIAAAADPISVK
ncbi:MAG: SGNH/GDSL hydrolase family protein [Oscillospiraceae bacterium]|nr:SGNH/GDSL hydrolase family protein [Oscillospiraceae bacterium]